VELCQICGREFKNLKSLGQHLIHSDNKISHNISTTKEYYDMFLLKENENLCKICRKEAGFINLNVGYQTYCSRICYNKDPEIRNIRCESNKNKIVSEETKNKMSSIRKKLWKDPNYRMKDPNIQKQKSKKMKENWKNGVYIEMTKKISIIMKELWKDPNCVWRSRKFLDKVINGRRERMLNGGSSYANSFNKNPSKPQVELYERTKKLYSSSIINYPCLNYSLDIAIPDLKIVIESDGSYWHQDSERDLKRQKEVESLGWRFIRYKNIDYIKDIPSIDKIKNDIELLCKEINVNG
jgi:very-short-patch-repair endonuclease